MEPVDILNQSNMQTVLIHNSSIANNNGKD